jgi:hypothetical protein
MDVDTSTTTSTKFKWSVPILKVSKRVPASNLKRDVGDHSHHLSSLFFIHSNIIIHTVCRLPACLPCSIEALEIELVPTARKHKEHSD